MDAYQVIGGLLLFMFVFAMWLIRKLRQIDHEIEVNPEDAAHYAERMATKRELEVFRQADHFEGASL